MPPRRRPRASVPRDAPGAHRRAVARTPQRETAEEAAPFPTARLAAEEAAQVAAQIAVQVAAKVAAQLVAYLAAELAARGADQLVPRQPARRATPLAGP